MAIDAAMDEATVSNLIANEAFDAVFKAIDSKAHAKWLDRKQEEVSQRRVKSMAQEDAPEHYRMLRRLVRERASQMTPSDNARILTDLIKMSGALKEDSAREVVELSPGQLDWLLEGDRETEEALAKLDGQGSDRR